VKDRNDVIGRVEGEWSYTWQLMKLHVLWESKERKEEEEDSLRSNHW